MTSIIETIEVKSLCERLDILGDPTRIRILMLLKSRLATSVSQLAEILSVHDSMMSHHLSVLFQQGLVTRVKSGKFQIYSLNRENMDKLRTDFVSLLGASHAESDGTTTGTTEDSDLRPSGKSQDELCNDAGKES